MAGGPPAPLAHAAGFLGGFWMQIALAVIASLALSAWSFYAVSVPNPDAARYLRAAELFVLGSWVDGLELFKLPFFSMLIAVIMLATDLDALTAATILNSVLFSCLVVMTSALAYELSSGDRTVVSVTVVLTLLHSQLINIVPLIIRDHGYLLFFVATILISIKDNRRPSWRLKLTLVLAIFAASLFRIEGLYLGVLVVGYYVLCRLRTTSAKVIAISTFTLITSALLPFAFLNWNEGSLFRWLTGDASAPGVSAMWAVVSQRVDILQNEVLTYGSGQGWKGYISLVVGLAFFQIVRAITPVYAVLGAISLVPNRLIPRSAILPIGWYAIGQLPLLLLFAFVNAMLEWRYALSLSLVLMFGAIFTVTSSWRDLLAGRRGSAVIFPLIAGSVLVAWLIDLPRPKPNHPVHEAGEWIREHVPANARLWTNEPRVAYLAGLPYDETGGVTEGLAMPPTDFEINGDVDVIVLSANGGPQVPPRPVENLELKVRFESGSDVVSIYSACPRMFQCPSVLN